MKMLAYRFHPLGNWNVRDLAAAIMDTPLAERSFLGRNDLRLEDWHDGRQFLSLVFGKPRLGHGPGQMSRDAPLADIRLGNGRSFGEDTAVVIEKNSGFAAIQYNHFGPRGRAIGHYLNASLLSLDPESQGIGFSLGAVLSRDVVERIRNMEVIKEVDFTVSLPSLAAADREAGRALGAVVAHPHPAGTETLHITYKAARARDASLRPDDVRSWLEDLLPFANSGLRSAKVTGRAEEGAERETIDLIEEQIAAIAQILPGPAQRLDLNERWQALADALRQWLLNGELQG